MKRIAALATFAALTIAGTAQAQPRPMFWQAHAAVHVVLDDYADLIDGHLVVGPCARRGHRSVVCRARIDGPAPQRYRVIVTSPRGTGRLWALEARPVR